MKYAKARNSAQQKQRGVYAIEFAFVFLIFFSLLYGIITYGMLFAFRLNVQNAAEQGARAALRYKPSIEDRRKYAEEIAGQNINWLPDSITQKAEAIVCRADSLTSNSCNSSNCDSKWENRCQMVVTVTAGDMRNLLPPLPAFLIPEKIIGKASMLLDGP